MASVWHASGICTDAWRAGGALTLGGESGESMAEVALSITCQYRLICRCRILELWNGSYSDESNRLTESDFS